MGKLYGVFYHIIGDGHTANQVLESDDLITREYLVYLPDIVSSCIFHNVYLLLVTGIIQEDVKHKSIELGFWKGIRSFLFDGILRSQNKEWPWQFVPLPANRHAFSLHRFNLPA